MATSSRPMNPVRGMRDAPALELDRASGSRISAQRRPDLAKCDVVPFIVHCGRRALTAARDNEWNCAMSKKPTARKVRGPNKFKPITEERKIVSRVEAARITGYHLTPSSG